MKFSEYSFVLGLIVAVPLAAGAEAFDTHAVAKASDAYRDCKFESVRRDARVAIPEADAIARAMPACAKLRELLGSAMDAQTDYVGARFPESVKSYDRERMLKGMDNGSLPYMIKAYREAR